MRPTTTANPNLRTRANTGETQGITDEVRVDSRPFGAERDANVTHDEAPSDATCQCGRPATVRISEAGDALCRGCAVEALGGP